MSRHLHSTRNEQPRERAVPCSLCRHATWNLCALCDTHCQHTDALTESPTKPATDIPQPRWTPPRQANPTPGTEASFAVTKLRRQAREQLAAGYTPGGVMGLLDQTVMAQIGVAALRVTDDEALGGIVRALIAAADEIVCDLLVDAQAGQR